jgi:hypothetical protein
LNLPLFYRVHSPFYSPRGVLTVCGTPTGGPGQQELFYERYGGHLLELLSVVLSAEKLMCVSTARIWPCTALSCTVSGASVTQQQSRAVTVGTGPSVRGRDGVVPWRAHCYSARLGSPITGHHHTRSAVTGLHTVRVLCAVIRRAVLETDGLTVVSAYLPRVPVAGRSF